MPTSCWRLEESALADRAILVGVTSRDIGTPLFTYHFGRARLSGSAAVVSWARLSPAWYGKAADPELTMRRTALEVVHELGHVWGLKHCHDFACLMRLAPTVDALDLRGTTICGACRALQGGLQALR